MMVGTAIGYSDTFWDALVPRWQSASGEKRQGKRGGLSSLKASHIGLDTSPLVEALASVILHCNAVNLCFSRPEPRL